ncbi:YybH family protein [Streptomyces sp. NPDC054834]
MSTTTHTTKNDAEILRGVLAPWKAAVDAHDPQRVASLYTEDAIFQGLHPYTVGHQGIAEYYDSQPLGMTAEFRILETRRLADDLVLGYLDAEFSFTDRTPVAVKLALVVRRVADGWSIVHYQVSRLN